MEQKKNCPLNLLFCGYSQVVQGDYPHNMTSHQFWQGDLCVKGSAQIVFPQYTLTVKPYDILIIPPDVPHMFCYTSKTEQFCCYSFKFDLETNLTASLSCLSNIGPGLNGVGPYGNFNVFSNFSKFILTIVMIAGRLELIPILLLFSPRTWKKNI